MIGRTLARCARPRGNSALGYRIWARTGQRARNFSTTSHYSASSPSPFQPDASILGAITAELDQISPRFEMQPSQIRILRGPADFYETLKAKILNAKRRIYLSTLYIGKTEHELIATIQQALRENPELKVSFLTDALRGTRETPNPSCASLLVPLVKEFGRERVEIRMFHTPNLTGIRKKLIPRRINEGWGLQHMKLYGVDEELILSGANLSNDYFTDRQDRYHVFSSPELTEYFANVHSAVCRLSYLIEPSDSPVGYVMTWPSSNSSPSPLEDPSAFKSSSTSVLTPLLRPKSVPSSPASSCSTFVYPVLQLTPLLTPDTSTELPSLLSILRCISPSQSPTLTPDAPHSPCSWTFTAGYFNPSPLVTRALLATRPSYGTVITAHPHANGFYLSPGVSGMLPDAYTHLSLRFLNRVRRAGLAGSIGLKEWKRGIVNTPGGWTYHAKGFWVTLPGKDGNTKDAGPSLTVIGSSNYTKRSYSLDIEANVVVVARDDSLKKKLAEEEQWLQEFATRVDGEEFVKKERKVSLKVRAAMWIVSVLGGAL